MADGDDLSSPGVNVDRCILHAHTTCYEGMVKDTYDSPLAYFEAYESEQGIEDESQEH